MDGMSSHSVKFPAYNHHDGRVVQEVQGFVIISTDIYNESINNVLIFR